VPPFSDGTGVLEALARLGKDGRCLNEKNLARAVAAVSHKSSLCFVLAGWNEDALRFLESPELRRRKVHLYLPGFRRDLELPHGLSVQHFGPDALEPRSKVTSS
jgi:hypothetical protein